MKRYDLLTPEGTRDLLFDECVALRKIENTLTNIFLSHSYTEVVTPGLEFFDVFSLKSRYFAQESMYKLTDAKGRLMVLRPDSTMPIARLVGTRLRDETFPLKLFYNQSIYRANPKNSGRDDEFSQSGIEIIGGDVAHADIEALSIAIEVMESLETSDYRFEIGDSAFFSLISAKLGLTDDELSEARIFVQNKNYPGLSELLASYGENPYAKALALLPSLFGGKEVFEKAAALLPDDNTRFALDKLRNLYNNLCALGVEDKITVDLGLVSKNENYYTGVVFMGYAAGYGMPVLTGGRYDKLINDFGVDVPATGFAVNLNAAAEAIIKNASAPLIKCADVLVYADEDNAVNGILHSRKLIAQGLTVDYADFKTLNEARENAHKKNISRLDVVTADGVTSITL